MNSISFPTFEGESISLHNTVNHEPERQIKEGDNQPISRLEEILQDKINKIPDEPYLKNTLTSIQNLKEIDKNIGIPHGIIGFFEEINSKNFSEKKEHISDILKKIEKLNIKKITQSQTNDLNTQVQTDSLKEELNSKNISNLEEIIEGKIADIPDEPYLKNALTSIQNLKKIDPNIKIPKDITDFFNSLTLENFSEKKDTILTYIDKIQSLSQNDTGSNRKNENKKVETKSTKERKEEIISSIKEMEKDSDVFPKYYKNLLSEAIDYLRNDNTIFGLNVKTNLEDLIKRLEDYENLPNIDKYRSNLNNLISELERLHNLKEEIDDALDIKITGKLDTEEYDKTIENLTNILQKRTDLNDKQKEHLNNAIKNLETFKDRKDEHYKAVLPNVQKNLDASLKNILKTSFPGTIQILGEEVEFDTPEQAVATIKEMKENINDTSKSIFERGQTIIMDLLTYTTFGIGSLAIKPLFLGLNSISDDYADFKEHMENGEYQFAILDIVTGLIAASTTVAFYRTLGSFVTKNFGRFKTNVTGKYLGSGTMEDYAQRSNLRLENLSGQDNKDYAEYRQRIEMINELRQQALAEPNPKKREKMISDIDNLNKYLTIRTNTFYDKANKIYQGIGLRNFKDPKYYGITLFSLFDGVNLYAPFSVVPFNTINPLNEEGKFLFTKKIATPDTGDIFYKKFLREKFRKEMNLFYGLDYYFDIEEDENGKKKIKEIKESKLDSLKEYINGLNISDKEKTRRINNIEDLIKNSKKYAIGEKTLESRLYYLMNGASSKKDFETIINEFLNHTNNQEIKKNIRYILSGTDPKDLRLNSYEKRIAMLIKEFRYENIQLPPEKIKELLDNIPKGRFDRFKIKDLKTLVTNINNDTTLGTKIEAFSSNINFKDNFVLIGERNLIQKMYNDLSKVNNLDDLNKLNEKINNFLKNIDESKVFDSSFPLEKSDIENRLKDRSKNIISNEINRLKIIEREKINIIIKSIEDNKFLEDEDKVTLKDELENQKVSIIEKRINSLQDLDDGVITDIKKSINENINDTNKVKDLYNKLSLEIDTKKASLILNKINKLNNNSSIETIGKIDISIDDDINDNNIRNNLKNELDNKKSNIIKEKIKNTTSLDSESIEKINSLINSINDDNIKDNLRAELKPKAKDYINNLIDNYINEIDKAVNIKELVRLKENLEKLKNLGIELDEELNKKLNVFDNKRTEKAEKLKKLKQKKKSNKKQKNTPEKQKNNFEKNFKTKYENVAKYYLLEKGDIKEEQIENIKNLLKEAKTNKIPKDDFNNKLKNILGLNTISNNEIEDSNLSEIYKERANNLLDIIKEQYKYTDNTEKIFFKEKVLKGLNLKNIKIQDLEVTIEDGKLNLNNNIIDIDIFMGRLEDIKQISLPGNKTISIFDKTNIGTIKFLRKIIQAAG